MRKTRLIFLVLLVLSLVGPAAAEARKKAKPCPRGVALEHSAEARLDIGGRNDEFVLRGCHLRSRKRTVLARWFNCGCSRADEPGPTAWLAGRYVAVHNYSCPPSTSVCTGGFTLFDLRSGVERYGVETRGLLSGLVLKPNGSLAYVLPQQLIPVTGGDQRLVRIDSRGEVVLDEGAGIDGGSLAANFHRLYWTRDGVPKTADFF